MPEAEKLDVHGHSVIYDDNSKIGTEHLNNLSYEETEKIFSEAATNGSTAFTDKNGYGYKLVCNYNSTYSITRKY